MDRREFLKSTGAAAAAATAATTAMAEVATAATPSSNGVAAPALASGVIDLRLAIAWPDAVAGPADQARRLGQRLAAMSGGRYRIAFLPGIDNGLAAVRAGEADLYYASEHDHLGAHRALAYFAGLPGDRGIAARQLSAWMLVGGGQQLWDELAGELGVKAMLAGHTGERPCFVASRRVGDMSGLAGEKVAVAGLAREVVRGFGLDPIGIPRARVADALARGELLAAECGGAIASHALGLFGAAKSSAAASVNRHGSAVSLGLRRSLWDSLPASDQAIFAAAAAAEYQLALAEEEAHRHLLCPASLADNAWPVARELARTILRVADAVVAHVAASDVQAQRINAGYVAFRRALLGEEPSLTRELA
jgi:TRAP-type mannitol/chloroaromatic compound transport system substrate-binding protein